MSKKGIGIYEFALEKKLPYGTFPKLANFHLKIQKEKGIEYVTKIIIAIKNETMNESKKIAQIKAVNIVNLMSVKSNLPSNIYLTNSSFQEYSSNKKHVSTSFRITAHPYKKPKITKKDIEKLNSDPIFSQQIARLSNAINYSYNFDWVGMVLELHNVLKEKYPSNLIKYRYLRNALSHDELKKARKNVERYFGKGYFDFTANNQFDFTSEKNQTNLQKEAGEFFAKVMNIFSKK